jgi:hypothetical protein
MVKLVELYIKLIRNGIKTIEQVPANLRDKVEAGLKGSD